MESWAGCVGQTSQVGYVPAFIAMLDQFAVQKQCSAHGSTAYSSLASGEALPDAPWDHCNAASHLGSAACKLRVNSGSPQSIVWPRRNASKQMVTQSTTVSYLMHYVYICSYIYIHSRKGPGFHSKHAKPVIIRMGK